MKNNLLTGIKMLYDNQTLMKAPRISMLLAFLVLLVNVTFISAPNAIGLMRGVEVITYIDDVEVAFAKMYDSGLNCVVSQEAIMVCEGPFEETYGAYAFEWVEAIDLDAVEVSTILFSAEEAAIVYVENPMTEDEELTVLIGRFHLLGGFDFSTIEMLAEDSEDVANYYDEVTEHFLRNLYFSNFTLYITIIYLTQFAQLFLYVMVVSLFYLLLNYRAKMKKITWSASFKITVVAMSGPALLAALFGFIAPEWAGIIFVFVYLARIIVLYYRINRVEETLT